MTTELSYPTDEDFVEARMILSRYGNAEHLGNEWLEKKRTAEKNKLTEAGKPNPNHPRLLIEAEMARLAYDMAYLVKKNQLMANQIEFMLEMVNRVAILEGAYSHLRGIAQDAQANYLKMMEDSLNRRRARQEGE